MDPTVWEVRKSSKVGTNFGVRAFGASCSSAGLRQGTYLGVIEPDRSRDSRGDYYHRYNCPQARLL
jgi:hypothetical protein